MTDDSPRMSCTEREFEIAFRKDGFLSPYMDEAANIYAQQNAEWFALAEALNRAGLEAFYRRDNEVVGLTSLHPIPLSIRMTFRALSAFQGAIILYRRGMIAEGDTLARNIYETAFWLGFIHEDSEAAARSFVNDERKSQRDRATFYLDQFKSGAYPPHAEIEAELKDRLAELNAGISKADTVSVKEAAKRSGLYQYYDAYKHLSASSAHNSLNSLHRYLNRNPDGSFDGHIVGPNPDELVDAVPLLCTGLGIALAMFCTIVPMDGDEAELNSLLIQIDELRRAQKADRAGLDTMA